MNYRRLLDGAVRFSPRLAVVTLWLGAALLSMSARAEDLTFERDIRPLLKAHCLDCHGGSATEGQLDLRLRRLMVRGGDSGAAIEPGKPEESYLLARIEAGEMPPGNAKMEAHEIDVIRRWIAAGAPTAREEPQEIGEGLGITPEERAFWAFQPLTRPAVPAFGPEDRVATPIDAFLVERLKAAGLKFSPEADPRVLIRRASFDLTGLPPTREEIAEYLSDTAPGAYERMIDRLLASPRYGERWARHWLDVAGYADSEGASNNDAVRPYVYKYRDYVIRSLNADKPFDQFLHEQLAGDEMVPPPYANLAPEAIEKLTATGFLRLAADGTGSGNNTEESRNQVIADTLKNVSNAFLGLSVACAQCHDHRYDPISHVDYHRLRAVFEPAFDWKSWRTPDQRRVSLFTDADREKSAAIEAEARQIAAERAEKQTQYMKQALDMELAKFEEPLREQLRAAYETPAKDRTPEQEQLLKSHPSVNISPGVLYQYLPDAAEELKKYDARIAEVRAKKPVEDFVRALTERPGQTPPTHLFHRGDYRMPKQEIAPGDLTVAAPEGQAFNVPGDDPSLPTTGRRLAYARHLTNGRHPLAGRALVNRVWMHHFGRGIVATPSEFGKLGEAPSHPELLDWLACEFADSGWSLKRLHQLIMTSTAYRQSSRRTPEADAMDADNRLLSRAPLRRLEGESVRDSVLAVSGSLNQTMYGPADPVDADETGQAVVKDDKLRRGVYVQVRRTQPAALLTTFDAPDMLQSNCERRTPSTVAGQSLMLLNSDFILDHAARVAARVEREANEYVLSPELTEGVQRPAALDGAGWQYGYGRFDEAAGFVVAFQRLPHWTGSSWQGGPTLPDPQTGWAILHAAGGHAGNTAEFAAIRRWTAPRAGTLSITGTLGHGSPNGDGVRGRIVAQNKGLLGEWTVHNSQAATAVEGFEVSAGETIDLVVDCRTNSNTDSYTWPVTLTFEGKPIASQETFSGPPPSGIEAQAALAWELSFGRPLAREELQLTLNFLGQQMETMRADARYASKPEAERLRQAMTNLAQTLLGSNEFLYID
jgi:mono/diheme cytochrome c family protein